MKSRLVTLKPSGTRIEVVEAGKGKDLLYLHGAGGHMPDDPLIAELATRYRVVAPLLPGYGQSSGEESLRDMLDITLHSLDVMAALKLDKPIVVGHSMGGMIAAEMAAIAHTEITRLCLLAPAGLWLDAIVRSGKNPATSAKATAAGITTLLLGVGAVSGWLAVGYGYPRRLVANGSVFATHGSAAMFRERPSWLPDYEYVAAGVRASGAKKVGLVQQTNSWEYPWWALLPGTRIVSLQSLIPKHPPAKATDTDAVICVQTPEAECRTRYLPPGWTLHMHGIAGYALPPGKSGA